MKRFSYYLSTLLVVVLFSIGFVSCGGDDDDENIAINEYVGSWSCTSPNNLWETIVTEGTTLVITSSGDMTWTLPNGSKFKATMRALGDDWVDITYKGKKYTAEMYVIRDKLTINANGNVDNEDHDFPFDGGYNKMN